MQQKESRLINSAEGQQKERGLIYLAEGQQKRLYKEGQAGQDNRRAITSRQARKQVRYQQKEGLGGRGRWIGKR